MSSSELNIAKIHSAILNNVDSDMLYGLLEIF